MQRQFISSREIFSAIHHGTFETLPVERITKETASEVVRVLTKLGSAEHIPYALEALTDQEGTAPAACPRKRYLTELVCLNAARLQTFFDMADDYEEWYLDAERHASRAATSRKERTLAIWRTNVVQRWKLHEDRAGPLPVIMIKRCEAIDKEFFVSARMRKIVGERSDVQMIYKHQNKIGKRILAVGQHYRADQLLDVLTAPSQGGL